MSQNYICYNNKFYEEGKALFPLNRAMKYGDGLFESIRIIDGRPKYLDFHFHRLQKGLSALKIDFSQAKWEEIRTCLTQLIIRNEIEKGGRIRITLFRSGQGKYQPNTHELEYIIEGEKLTVNGYQLNGKGLSVDFSESVFHKTPFTNFKTTNALPYVLASIEKEEKGFDELLLLNSNGQIIEATSSNVFVVIGQEIYTPPLTAGCLDGVMRRAVISKLCTLNYKVKEENIGLEKMEEADELFFTNAIQGVQWVGSFRKKRYFNKVSNRLIGLI